MNNICYYFTAFDETIDLSRKCSSTTTDEELIIDEGDYNYVQYVFFLYKFLVEYIIIFNFPSIYRDRKYKSNSCLSPPIERSNCKQ